MLGVSKIIDLLQCYDGYDDEFVSVGQRYGFYVAGTGETGYNFLSGGGGMIFNRKTAIMLNRKCSCPPVGVSLRKLLFSFSSLMVKTIFVQLGFSSDGVTTDKKSSAILLY